MVSGAFESAHSEGAEATAAHLQVEAIDMIPKSRQSKHFESCARESAAQLPAYGRGAR